MKKRIIIGYNDSPQGDDALGLGGQLAAALDATAMVTTVVGHPRHGLDGDELKAAVAEFCEPLFSRARERLRDVAVLERPLVSPSRSRAIYELAEKEPPAAIVIGSTHRGPVGRVLLGSLGDSLLSGAPCAVAVAPQGYGNPDGGLERIGVAFDGRSESGRALTAGIELARRLGIPLRLVSVVDPPAYALGGLLSGFDRREYREFEERETDGVLEKGAERVPAEIAVERERLEGDPAEALAEAASDLDLLIVGSRSYGPITHTLLGSVSAKLMATAPCAVMVVPRGAGTHPFGD